MEIDLSEKNADGSPKWPLLLAMQFFMNQPLNWALHCEGGKVVARTEDDWDVFDPTRA